MDLLSFILLAEEVDSVSSPEEYQPLLMGMLGWVESYSNGVVSLLLLKQEL